MFGLGYQELLIILVIVLILFGANRLPDLARSLGSSVKEFKKGVSERYRATAAPIVIRNAPVPARAPAATGAAGTEIKFTKGQAIVVDATINGRASAKLILDTGADRTVINPRVLEAAGVALTQGATGQIRGATGTASVQAAALDSLEVGGAKVSKLLVIAHDIEQAAVDGLLGRDFLDQFQVVIASDSGVATLAPKNP